MNALYEIQMGIQRLAKQGVNVQIEVEQIIVAFENRQPDAMERAERLRDRLVRESNRLLDEADHQNRMIARGWDWRETKEERALSRATANTAAASHVSDLIEIFKNLRLRDPNTVDAKGMPTPGATTETLYHLRHRKGGDPVIRLRATNHLTDDHVRAAREIEAVQRWVTAGMGLKVQRLPVKIDPSDDESGSHSRTPLEHQEHMALLHALVYAPWTHGMDPAGWREHAKGKRAMSAGEQIAAVSAGMALQLVAGDSLKEVAKRHQMRWEKALNRVQSALDRYGKMRGEFSRETHGSRKPAASNQGR